MVEIVFFCLIYVALMNNTRNYTFSILLNKPGKIPKQAKQAKLTRSDEQPEEGSADNHKTAPRV